MSNDVTSKAGGLCWYCYWGWSEPVVAIYRKAVADLGGDDRALHYGPAHIVWDDENFGRDHVQWCLDHFDEYVDPDQSAAHNLVVRRSLEELLALPDEVRDPEPEAYQLAGSRDHPRAYPPPAGVVMADP